MNFNGLLLKTLGERIKYLQKNSGKNQVEFAQSLGVSKGSLLLYQKNGRSPDSSFLITLCEMYRVNPAWLLLGENEPFILERIQEKGSAKESTFATIDPVVQLLNDEEDRAGITLTPEQRTAILKILRELVDRDVRSIRELLRSIPGGKKQGDE
jgi:transcriptional regulator with XRE-family HTH domain